MVDLHQVYASQARFAGPDLQQTFVSFFENEVTPVENWINTQMKNEQGKNDVIAVDIRNKGNESFKIKVYISSLYCYGRSLQYATYKGDAYVLALANRSAAFYKLDHFKESLEDIHSCLKIGCATTVKAKLLLRQIKCCHLLELEELYADAVNQASTFIRENEDTFNGKDLALFKKHIQQVNEMPKRTPCSYPVLKDPELRDGPNDNFLYASSAIHLSYDQSRGRHVVASKDLAVGDVLFIEKAFALAPVYEMGATQPIFSSRVCYYCLKTTLTSIPCWHCSQCMFCNKQCRDSSWNEFHKWDCTGMKANLWYELGIGLLALRVLLKGVPSGFATLSTSNEDDTRCFGNKEDNYPYFNKLVSNISETTDVTQFIVLAAALLVYLQKYTDFFEWLIHTPNCPKLEMPQLVTYIGGLLTKHIAQLYCNSSVISWFKNKPMCEKSPSYPVAAAIYPSVSMMNHSCKPNISIFFMDDTIVVKAIDEIGENEEIFNCYGAEYGILDRLERQARCKEFYGFECTCIVCSNDEIEHELDDRFKCPTCEYPIPQYTNTNFELCLGCKKQISLKSLRDAEDVAQEWLQSGIDNNDVSKLYLSLATRKDILYDSHRNIDECYVALSKYYAKKGDLCNQFCNIKLSMDLQQERLGQYSLNYGYKLYQACVEIFSTIVALECNTLPQYSNVITWLLRSVPETRLILELHHPVVVIDTACNALQSDLSYIHRMSCLFSSRLE